MAAIREWYGGYSIIYRWFENRFGEDALYEYWHYVAKEVYPELAQKFRDGGPAFIASYFTDIILEDEGKLCVEADKNSVTVKILECPDHIWQTHYDQGYSMPNSNYYRSYEVIYADVAKMAGYDFELLEYDTQGRLKFRFTRQEASL